MDQHDPHCWASESSPTYALTLFFRVRLGLCSERRALWWAYRIHSFGCVCVTHQDKTRNVSSSLKFAHNSAQTPQFERVRARCFRTGHRLIREQDTQLMNLADQILGKVRDLKKVRPVSVHEGRAHA